MLVNVQSKLVFKNLNTEGCNNCISVAWKVATCSLHHYPVIVQAATAALSHNPALCLNTAKCTKYSHKYVVTLNQYTHLHSTHWVSSTNYTDVMNCAPQKQCCRPSSVSLLYFSCTGGEIKPSSWPPTLSSCLHPFPYLCSFLEGT